MIGIIEAFFDRVIEGDKQVVEVVNVANGLVFFENRQLVFDLPSLHRAIFPLNDVGYSVFKKLLYGGELNKCLAVKGAVVEVYSYSNSTKKGKVNANLYCLQIGVK